MRGSCCCGAVKFELTSPPVDDGNMPLLAMSQGWCQHLRFRESRRSTMDRGRDQVVRHEPALPYKYARCFCRICGTALGEILSDQSSFPIAANALDDDPVVRNRFHEFVSEKPAWYDICDEAKQFDAHPSKA